MLKSINKKIICIISILFLIVGTFSGYNLVFAATVGEPEAISMVIYDDAYSSRGFAWLSDTSVIDGAVEYVQASGGIANIDWNSSDIVKVKGSFTQKDNYNSYKATVKGLNEGEKYYYRIGSRAKNAFSSVATISMPAKAAESMSFIWFTDPQETSAQGYKNVNKVLTAAVKTNPNAEFFLGTGDNVNSSYQGSVNYSEWKYLFGETSDITRNYPLMTVAGNHETINGAFSARFNYDFQGGENDKVNGGFYSFDYGDVHFAMINTNEAERSQVFEGSQLPWLKEDLKNTDKKWKIVGTHRNAMTVGTYYDASETLYIKEKLLPIMSEFNVDFVFQGHNHVYSRTNPYSFGVNTGHTPNTELEYFTETFLGEEREFASEPDGTTYMMINYSGNKQYEVANTDPKRISVAHNPVRNEPSAAAPHMPMFASITVEGNRLALDSYVVDRDNNTAKLFDTFSVAKNTYVEVAEMIDALPSVYDVYYTDARAIKAAKNAFEKLTPSAKNKLDDDYKKKLEGIIIQIGDLSGALAVLDVEDGIGNLPQPNLTSGFIAALEEVEREYNALSSGQKLLVKNSERLVSIKGDLSDMQKADDVVKLIAELNNSAAPDKIVEARQAYNKLTSKQRGYVTNLEHLTTLEANLLNDNKGCNGQIVLQSRILIFMIFGAVLFLLFILTLRRKSNN